MEINCVGIVIFTSQKKRMKVLHSINDKVGKYRARYQAVLNIRKDHSV
ncbi:hypothetical protein PI124_g18820 [Phytophthora idaei]|nr:hypothetical protein PI125_g19715 [Phytophthora idaei]KAG3135655.1 hypothetical protein PI126_g18153 [Phytophthora idaei]KAG3236168.1 hypothetical protein PI124_g18820 [Phytophthora idaei]